MSEKDKTEALLARIADALERLAPRTRAEADFDAADAFVWHAETLTLEPVAAVNRVDLSLLKGIERQVATLLENTRRFADGLPANNALLWGARGTGKSSLVKAAGPRVAADAALPGLDLEDAEPAQLDALAALHGGPHRVEDGVDSHLSFDLGDVGDPRHFVDDVDLDHA
jgi:predicted AAA+ superfamily ATPase